MPLQTIEPRRLYRQIADQLGALLRSGEFAVGSRLPTERALAEQLGVSRPSVREALIALEVEGLVEVRVGSGIYVVSPQRPRGAPAVAADAFGPFEIMQARLAIETELAAMAAGRIGQAQLQQLQQALDQMQQEITQGLMPVRSDQRFHRGLAEAAGNGPLLRCLDELLDERHNPLFERMGQHYESPHSWRQAMGEHRTLLAAVASGSASAARRAMRSHLQRSQHRFAHGRPQPLGAAAPARRQAQTPFPTPSP